MDFADTLAYEQLKVSSLSPFNSYNHPLHPDPDHCNPADRVSVCLMNSDRSGLEIKATL